MNATQLSRRRPLRTRCGLVAALLLFLGRGGLASQEEAIEVLRPTGDQTELSEGILQRLQRYHYRDRELDDELSSHLFDRYVDYLDPWRAYFLASDIAELDKYRYTLDDSLRRGDIRPGFEIFNRYRQRELERLDALRALVKNGLEGLSFEESDWLELDRENAAWPQSKHEADELWRKRLKFEVLDRKLAGRTMEQIEESLLRMYDNRIHRVKQIESSDVFSAYMNILAQGYDPHTTYFPPRDAENFEIEMSLSLEGIGALLGTEGEYVIVRSIIPGGPAEKSGDIVATDRIVAVGQGDEEEPTDVVGWRLDDVVQMIRGQKGTVVRLAILSEDRTDLASARTIRLVRDEIKLEEQAAQKKLIEIERDGHTYRIGLIELDAFYMDFQAYRKGDPDYRSSTRDVERILLELKKEKVDGVVLDLRRNGGGSLIEAKELTGLFLGRRPIVQVRNSGGRKEVLKNESPAVYEGPLVVLVDRLSASASEIFAAAVQDYGRGVVVGGRTFGKGTVQTIVPVDDGQLKLTQATFYRVTGGSTQHRGVVPDIDFPNLYDPERVGESALDEALPWDDIEPLNVLRDEGLSAILPRLVELHRKRVGRDPEFVYLEDRLAFSARERKRTRVALQEEARRAEQEDFDARPLVIENRRRQAEGLEPVDDLDDVERPPVAETDALQREAAQILADLLST